MSLTRFKGTDFRCLAGAELALAPSYNLIVGPNASGKTSLLEGIAYLGRGRSFRGASTRELIRHGANDFVLTGAVDTGNRLVPLGVRNSAGGLEVQVDGERRQGAAVLAEVLPLQVIDPDVHNLVAGGPEDRRRYVDWVAFHVEHAYLEAWRRYRRALKQRNAALKQGGGEAALAGWDEELAGTGEAVDTFRRRTLDGLRPALVEAGESLLGSAIDFDYQSGWATEQGLIDALRAGIERDRQFGSTQAGPHRADIRLRFDERKARKQVSRGQQKLLASAMIVAAVDVVQRHLERPLLLLLDDPAAELDRHSLERLMRQVARLDCQVVATALEPDPALFPDAPRRFHVEHGVVRQGD